MGSAAALITVKNTITPNPTACTHAAQRCFQTRSRKTMSTSARSSEMKRPFWNAYRTQVSVKFLSLSAKFFSLFRTCSRSVSKHDLGFLGRCTTTLRSTYFYIIHYCANTDPTHSILVRAPKGVASQTLRSRRHEALAVSIGNKSSMPPKDRLQDLQLHMPDLFGHVSLKGFKRLVSQVRSAVNLLPQ